VRTVLKHVIKRIRSAAHVSIVVRGDSHYGATRR